MLKPNGWPIELEIDEICFDDPWQSIITSRKLEIRSRIRNDIVAPYVPPEPSPHRHVTTPHNGKDDYANFVSPMTFSDPSPPPERSVILGGRGTSDPRNGPVRSPMENINVVTDEDLMLHRLRVTLNKTQEASRLGGAARDACNDDNEHLIAKLHRLLLQHQALIQKQNEEIGHDKKRIDALEKRVLMLERSPIVGTVVPSLENSQPEKQQVHLGVSNAPNDLRKRSEWVHYETEIPSTVTPAYLSCYSFTVILTSFCC